MCTRVWAGRKDIATQQKLADFLGVGLRDLPLKEDYDDSVRVPGDCLCPIDVTGALTSAGHRWENFMGDQMIIRVRG